MGVTKQQLPVQACSQLNEYSKHLLIAHPKPHRISSSPELHTEPGTPLRVTSSGKGRAVLRRQSSQEDVTSDELCPHVMSLEHAVTNPAQATQYKEVEQQRAAAKQTVAVIIACLMWIFVSSATILINKHIMVDLS